MLSPPNPQEKWPDGKVPFKYLANYTYVCCAMVHKLPVAMHCVAMDRLTRD